MTPNPQPAKPDADPFANTSDPLIEEVRAARRAIEQQHGNDLRAHVEALRQLQKDWGAPVISDRGPASKQAG